MRNEVAEFLGLKPGLVVMDATVGGGGHACDILKRILPGGKLIGVDQDALAIEKAEEALKPFAGSFALVNDNFRNLNFILKNCGILRVSAILFDVGVSSFQIDDPSRGFSFQKNAILDMRMDERLAISARDIVNRYKESDLADIIYKYGEERFSRKIAKYIVSARQKKEIDTTFELRDIVHRAVRAGWQKIDPATRTFQALRIKVNDELGALEEAIDKAINSLVPGGRIAVISFHSLEDRIVKNKFKSFAVLGDLKIITKKPLTAGDEEVKVNPRARSAKLRIGERI